MSETGKHLFRAANVLWKYVQYVVIAACGKMHRDSRCVYMVHVYCLAAIGEDSVFYPWSAE